MATAVQEWMVMKMSNYIKREDALNAFNNAFYARLTAKINKIPSEDVAQVRHGMWVDVDRMQMHDLHGVLTWGNSFMCTECSFKTFAVEGHMSQYHYCPNCGARMDEEGEK